MKPELDFGQLKPTEASRVEDYLGSKVICSDCGATLSTYASKCTVPLETPCVGFLLIEGARLHFRRKADG